MRLDRKTVVLTGATGGIGQAIVQQLAPEGCHLVLVGRDAETLAKLKQRLSQSDKHHCLVADITSATDRERLVDYCLSLRHGIDLLINAAGISEFNLLQASDPKYLETIIATNLTAPMLLSQQLLPLLLSRPYAAIVNIGSIYGSIGYPGFSAYCTSKFGLRGFTESLRRELADSPVRVLYFAPRATHTEFNNDAVQNLNTELKNQTDMPQKVAARLARQLRKSNWRDTYLGWPEKFFVRINSLLPRLVDGALRKQLPVIQRHANTPGFSTTDAKPVQPHS